SEDDGRTPVRSRADAPRPRPCCQAAACGAGQTEEAGGEMKTLAPDPRCTIPSPLVGEGQGEGSRAGRRQRVFCCLSSDRSVRLLPLTLPSPTRRGEGFLLRSS